MSRFTIKELELLLEISCNEAQRYSDKGFTTPKSVYDIRYKIRDILKERSF